MTGTADGKFPYASRFQSLVHHNSFGPAIQGRFNKSDTECCQSVDRSSHNIPWRADEGGVDKNDADDGVDYGVIADQSAHGNFVIYEGAESNGPDRSGAPSHKIQQANCGG